MRTPEFVVGQAKLYVAWVCHLQLASEVGQSFEPEPFNLWDRSNYVLPNYLSLSWCYLLNNLVLPTYLKMILTSCWLL